MSIIPFYLLFFSFFKGDLELKILPSVAATFSILPTSCSGMCVGVYVHRANPDSVTLHTTC